MPEDEKKQVDKKDSGKDAKDEAEEEEQDTGDSGDDQDSPRKKPMSFYFAFLSLVIMVLIVSIDSTALAVAIPVSQRPRSSLPLNFDSEECTTNASGQNRSSPINWAVHPWKPSGPAYRLCCPSS